MKIGLTYDLKTDWAWDGGDPQDANAELDSPQTVETLAAALASGGHTVQHIGNVENLLRQIDTLDVDMVFNICEGRAGRNREAQVPVLLEMRGIPFVGSDGVTLSLTLDKVLAKKCFIADTIPTPRFFVARTLADLEAMGPLTYPLMVKPSCEGTSKGLTEQSRVADRAALARQVAMVLNTYKQPALIEEFISGTEFTVGVIGNEAPEALPVAQVYFDGRGELGENFFTYERVMAKDVVSYACPAPIAPEWTQRMQDIAVRAYQSVGCRDFGRVDFRVDAQGQPYVLEINPLPSLADKDVFQLFPRVMGTTFEALIQRILGFAVQRYGLNTDKTVSTTCC